MRESGDSLGSLLKAYRRRAGLTQEELAERAGISPRGLAYLERDERRPQPGTARRLAEALGLTESERASFLQSEPARSAATVDVAPGPTSAPHDRAKEITAGGAATASPPRLEPPSVTENQTAASYTRLPRARGTSQRWMVGALAALALALIIVVVGIGREMSRSLAIGQVGKPVAGWGEPRPLHGTRFRRPSDIALDASGNVFVADAGHGRIVELSPAGVPKRSYEVGASNAPSRIAVGQHGAVYAAWPVAGQGAMWIHYPTGSSPGYFPDVYSEAPSDFGVDSAGRLYLLSTAGQPVTSIDASNDITVVHYSVSAQSLNLLWTFDSSLTGSLCGQGMTLDRSDDVYLWSHACGANTITIQEFTGKGQQLNSWSLPGRTGLAVDGVGNMCLADARSGTIRLYSSSGTVQRVWHVGRLHGAVRLALDTGDTVYVADEAGNRVLRLSPDGTVFRNFGERLPPPPAGPIPAHIAVGPDGTVFVSDTSTRVHVFTSAGHAEGTWDTYCEQSGGTSAAPPLYADTSGHLYMSAADSAAVERYDSQGNCLDLIILPGSGTATLVGVGSTGKLLSTGSAPAGLQESDPNGAVLRTFGTVCAGAGCSPSKGQVTGYIGQPGAAMDTQGDVYVLEESGPDIIKFSSTGRVLAVFGRKGTAPGELQYPSAITTDARGYVYVADTGNNRIEKFSPDGKVVAVTGGIGTKPGRFNTPTDIAVDTRGDVYVVDLRNHRVQKFTPAH